MKITIRNLSKQKLNGPESKLVEKFLSSKEYFKEEGLEYTILKEAYTEIGIPDILILIWDKNAINKWDENRGKLNKSDMKIMHHISTKGKRGEILDNIIYQLGFSDKQTKQTIQKLLLSNLITEKENGRVCSKDINNNFFIRKIITVEAKMKNWKTAINQAELNRTFSSHSYVLLPNDKINDKIKANFHSHIGLLGQDGEKTILKKRAKKDNLPTSYFSWVLNEYIGRQVYLNNLI
jgi:hypothetical protein